MAMKHAVISLGMLFAAAVGDEAVAAANPIRRVVTMLQQMQKKVQAESDKEEEMYKNLDCWCKKSKASLAGSVSEASAKVPALEADISASEEKAKQIASDLEQHKADREDAKTAMKEASAVRDKENAAFLKEKGQYEENIGAINKAVSALSKGMAGGFLQTRAAHLLQKVIAAQADIADSDRSDILAFLSGSQSAGYAPQSGEITGLLRELGDQMKKDLADITKTEQSAASTFDQLMIAKKKEVQALSKSIEAKLSRQGEIGVEIQQMKNDLTDTRASLSDDERFLLDTEKTCSTKSGEWDQIQKNRAQELVTLAETIKMLNDDDALELFKGTLSQGSSAFVQLANGANSVRARALGIIRGAKAHQFDFIALALRGKKVGFDKVIKMIDAMQETLKKEQAEDDSKQEYCTAALDESDDKHKALMRAGSDLDTAMADASESLATFNDEITALEASIKELDGNVAQATANRKTEHATFVEQQKSDTAAKELLLMAKNRLNKFYNPKLPAQTKFVQVSKHHQQRVDPGPAPEAPGAYQAKTQESAGVVALLDKLIAELDTGLTEATTEEKDSQADYQQAMKDSADQRSAKDSALTQKRSAKATAETTLQGHKDGKSANVRDLKASGETISALHSECDWLLQYHGQRAEARSAEIDSLANAKAVLKGADFSLLQKSAPGFLKRA